MANCSALQMDTSFGRDLNISASSDQQASKMSANSAKVAVEFQKELNSVLQTKPPISKEKMNKIVSEAIKAVRNYKHVVYYVETFIKNVKNNTFLFVMANKLRLFFMVFIYIFSVRPSLKCPVCI